MEVWYIKARSQKDVNQNKKSRRITHKGKKNRVSTNGLHGDLGLVVLICFSLQAEGIKL
jgi:hypothetical protein